MDTISYAKASSAYKLASLVSNELVNKVDIEGSSILVPVGTTATRPILGAGESALRYNSDIGGLEGWTGTEWKNVSADITAVSLKGTDTETNILAMVGMVAEDLWVASDTLNGWVYDGAVWINIGPLQGPQGIQGIQGKSAYTVAVENGFVGTEAQWLVSLIGDTGATGDGIASIIKTYTVGLVDTYTVTMTSGATSTFTVTNGLDGVDGTDVDHVSKTSGTGAGGTTDVYTVWGNVAETISLGTFNVYNGVNGTGTVGSVVAGTNVTVDNTDPTSPIVGLGENVTVQGNTFNGAEQLVRLGVDGKLPVLDGSNLTGIDGLPDQTGFAGKYLTTDGTDASWAEVQSGSEHYDQEATPTSPTVGATWYKPSTGKIYTRVSDGATETWLDSGTANTGVTQTYVEDAIDAIDALPVQTGNSGKFLKTDGATAIWESIPPAVVVNTPSITSPTTGATDFLGTIASSAYGTVDNYKGVHDYSNWQLSYTSDFAIVQQESTVGNLTSWTPSVGLALQTCYVRVRYGSDNHLSEWSTAINFTTPNIYIQVPTMTVTGTPTDIPEQPTLTTSAFAVFNGTDTHVSTDWVITQGGTEIWSSIGDTTNKTSIVVPASELVVGTAYVFKARHNGTVYGSSGWVEINGTTKTTFTNAYGVEWNQTADTYTRTGLAVGTANSTSYAGSLQTGMRRCVLNANGTVNYYLHPTDSTKKADGSAAVIDGTAGNVMVEIPKFYYKYEYAAPVHKWSISPLQEAGYTIHPAFVRGGVEKNYRYYCAYEGYNNGGTLKSRSGVLPTASQTIATFRTQAQANGAGWSLIDWNLLYAVQMLFLTEYADFDTQAMIGNGNDTGSDYAITTGQSNGIGNASSPSTNNDMWMSYRGIENWYASMHKFIDGVNIQERVYYVNNNPATYASDVFTGDYVAIGVTSASTNGYVSNVVASNRGFVASAVAGSSSTFIPDSFYQATGNKIMVFGGYAGDGLGCGGFFLTANDAFSDSAAYLGSGVCF